MYIDRENIGKQFVHDGAGVKEALTKLEFQSVVSIFRCLLNNILLCVRALRDARGIDVNTGGKENGKINLKNTTGSLNNDGNSFSSTSKLIQDQKCVNNSWWDQNVAKALNENVDKAFICL